MCVRLHGVDDNFNRGVQHDNVKPLGLTFFGASACLVMMVVICFFVCVLCVYLLRSINQR
jgi:hypothetical protein